MYYINKLIDGFVNPFAIGVMLLVLAGILFARGRKKLGGGLLGAGLVWFYFWSTPFVASLIGYSIESQWPPQKAQNVQEADVIVLLGGGMGACPDKVPYPTLYGAADRVWHAARLYRKGKAPIIIPTGEGAKDCEKKLLEDFGVPEEAIVCEDEARNTEENAFFVKKLLEDRAQRGLVKRGANEVRPPSIILVTSALHMPRAKLMYERYASGFKIISAACDHECTIGWLSPRRPGDFIPSVYSLATSSYAFKEYLGYYGYKWLRR